MAKRIIWSYKAQKDRKNILNYWFLRNKSKTYSAKLNSLFQQAILLVSNHPNIGTPTNFGTVRSKIVRDYQIFYEVNDDSIHILTVWDSRQNPDKLPRKLK